MRTLLRLTESSRRNALIRVKGQSRTENIEMITNEGPH